MFEKLREKLREWLGVNALEDYNHNTHQLFLTLKENLEELSDVGNERFVECLQCFEEDKDDIELLKKLLVDAEHAMFMLRNELKVKEIDTDGKLNGTSTVTLVDKEEMYVQIVLEVPTIQVNNREFLREKVIHQYFGMKPNKDTRQLKVGDLI